MKTNNSFFLTTSLRTGLAAAVLGVTVALSGCAAAIVGAGAGATVAYKMGQLEATVSADLPATVSATTEALARLQLTLISQKGDGFGAEFIARTAMDKKVRVRLTGMTASATQVGIRVGVFGDESMSVKIYDQIRGNLVVK